MNWKFITGIPQALNQCPEVINLAYDRRRTEVLLSERAFREEFAGREAFVKRVDVYDHYSVMHGGVKFVMVINAKDPKSGETRVVEAYVKD